MPEGVVGNGGADEEGAAKEALATARDDLLDERIKPVVEADSVYDAGLLAGGGELGGFSRIDSQGLFANHVDIVLQGLEHKLVVQGVWRADVDGVDAAVDGGGQAVVGPRDSEIRRTGLGSLES